MEPEGYQVCLPSGRSYHYIDQRPGNGEESITLLCIHGFPDLSYGWRHQIGPWVAGGYRVIAPDMLGYGKTDMPREASAYSMRGLCMDLAALLDHVGVRKAVIIGHDWGSFIAGRFALWCPERLLALVLLSIPYTPPREHHVSVHEIAQKYPPFSYQVYFASEHSTSEIESNLALFFRLVYRGSKSMGIPLSRMGQLLKLPRDETELAGCILTDKELDHYVSNFQRGMIGPLSYYRTTKIRFEEEQAAALPSKLRADLPVLFMYGTEDVTCPPTAVQNSKELIDRLTIVPVSDVGHWIMIEAAQTVTEVTSQWLASVLDHRVPSRL